MNRGNYSFDDDLDEFIFCKSCSNCQFNQWKKEKYGHLPPKEAEFIPWETICVDLIGTYMIHNQKEDHKLMCMTMIDPATSWFKIMQVSIDDESSAHILQIFNNFWLS